MEQNRRILTITKNQESNNSLRLVYNEIASLQNALRMISPSCILFFSSPLPACERDRFPVIIVAIITIINTVMIIIATIVCVYNYTVDRAHYLSSIVTLINCYLCIAIAEPAIDRSYTPYNSNLRF